MRARYLGVATVTAAALLAAVPASAKDVKVPNSRDLEKRIAEFYGEVDPGDRQARDKILLEIDKILAKDKKGIALQHPQFWSDAIHAGRLMGKKWRDTVERTKKLGIKQVPVEYPEGKIVEVPMAFHGGTACQKKNKAPLLLTYLPKGEDPKAYLEALLETDERIKKEWIVAAIADTDEYGLSKEAKVVADPLVTIRDMFNIDANRWFLAGVGTACDAVQKAAKTHLPDRVAGIVLHGPAAADTNENTAMYSACVVHDDKGKAVADAYLAIDGEGNAGVAAGEGAALAVTDWLSNHPGRKSLKSYTRVTTIDENNRGELWGGTVLIGSPGKRGEPTKITVNYNTEGDNNAIEITSENLSEFYVYMNDDLVDMSKPVTVVVNGEQVATREFERNLRMMLDTVDNMGEKGRLFTARYRGVAKTEIAAPEKSEGDEGGDDKGGEDKGGDDKGGDDKGGDDKGGDDKGGDDKGGDDKGGDDKGGDDKGGDDKGEAK